MVKRKRVIARWVRKRQNINIVFRGIFVLSYEFYVTIESWRYFDICIIQIVFVAQLGGHNRILLSS
jgi:hypothetical protein